jgi:hypothetical protein
MTTARSAPVAAVKLLGQAAAPDLAKGPEQRGHILARGLKGHVAHHQLRALALGRCCNPLLSALLAGCCRRLLLPAAGLAHAQLQHQLVTVQH